MYTNKIMQSNNQLIVSNTESKELIILQEKIEKFEKFAYIINGIEVGSYNYFNLFIGDFEINCGSNGDLLNIINKNDVAVFMIPINVSCHPIATSITFRVLLKSLVLSKYPCLLNLVSDF